jgi:serine/threonine protein kinase
MSESVLKKFGKYFLLDRIGEGGMAEIFRARMSSLDETGRLIVIKRIQGAFSNNAEFLQMFKAEVQVTMRFTHPNIVQLYESGEENGQQFIAMELVDGRNVRQILSKVSQKQQRIPIAAACVMVEQTAAGLHYAHTFKDRITGEPLNLVHRDVSPQNILVSYDGNVKVIDFGIAKAATNGEATRAGVIKGKLSYLSPEQVMGDVLDARSDVFALGIVLWELLTGKRLFVAEGDNEFQVLKMIESCNTFVKPPSTYNPEVPKELDAIVMQALQRDLSKRYQNAEEMARHLRKLLAVQFSDFGPSDIANFVKKLFHELIVEDRKQLQNLNGRAEELIALGKSTAAAVVAPIPASVQEDEPHAKEHTRVTNLGNKFDKSQITSADRVELAGQPQQKKINVPAAKHNTRTGAGNAMPMNASRRSVTSSISRPVPVESETVGGSSGFAKALIVLAVLGGGGYFAFNQYMNSTPGESEHVAQTSQNPTLGNQAPVTQNPAGKLASLKLHLFPDGDLSRTRVTVNSVPYDLNRGGSPISMNDLVALVIERPGFVTFRKEFTIKDGDLVNGHEYDLDVKLEPMVYGTFTLSTQPEIADVTIISLDQGTSGGSQKPVVLKTPIYQEKLPVGHYKVVVKNEILNVEKVFQIEIKEGDRMVKNSVPLEPSRLPANNR